MTELVSSAHAKCFFAFEFLLESLQEQAHEYRAEISSTEIHDEFEKYKIWAGNVGAAHYGKRYEISLDYRLREASFLKEQVLKLLSTLEGRVKAAAALCRGERKSFDEADEGSSSQSSTLSGPEDGQEQDDNVSDNSPWDISSISSDQINSLSHHEQTDRSSDEPRTSNTDSINSKARLMPTVDGSSISEMSRLVQSIRFTITYLYRLPVRRPAPLDRIKNKTSVDTAIYQHFDVLYIKDKFPGILPQAAAQLGKMITRRRQILQYRDIHKQNLDSARLQPDPLLIPKVLSGTDQSGQAAPRKQVAPSQQALSQAASSNLTLRSKATTFEPGVVLAAVEEDPTNMLYAPSVAESKSSRASSYTAENLRIEVPSRPKNDQGQEMELFECPYCLLTQHISNGRKWKKHVLEDLQPYVCTYGGCELYEHFFDDRVTWFKHEAQYHRIKWFCNTEGHPEYDVETDFRLHMSSYHGQKLDERQFNLVKNMFCRPSNSLDGTCSLCQKFSKNLRSHISRHLQQIALFALPRLNETTGSGQVERDSTLSRYQKERFSGVELSEYSSSTSPRGSAQHLISNDLDSVDLLDEDDHEQGHDVPDVEGDQGWDSITDKFTKARGRTYRWLRVLIGSMMPDDVKNTASLIRSLRCEAVVFEDMGMIEVDVRRHGEPDAIILGDISGEAILALFIKGIRKVTNAAIIIVRRGAPFLYMPSNVSNWTQLINPRQIEIQEALETVCQWAPAPPDWQSTTVESRPSLPGTQQQGNLKFFPYDRNHDFVGRLALLDRMHQVYSGPASRLALVGLGGMGKSELALEFCYQSANQWQWVFWIHASSPSLLEESLLRIVDEADIGDRKNTRGNLFELLNDWLSQEKNGPWLLILDDINYVTDVYTWSRNNYGSILVTTQATHEAMQFADNCDIITVGQLDAKEGCHLLTIKLRGINFQDHDVDELAAELEYVPLALVHAATYMQQSDPKISVRQYLDLYKRNDQSRIAMLEPELGELRRDWDVSSSVIMTWQKAFEHIRAFQVVPMELLSLMSFFDAQAIPQYLLHDESSLDGAYTSEQFDNALGVLHEYSLITSIQHADTEPGTIKMHNLLQVAVRHYLETMGQSKTWQDRSILKLFVTFPSGQYSNWKECEALFPHVLAAMTHRPRQNHLLENRSILLLRRAAEYALARGRIDHAELIAKEMKDSWDSGGDVRDTVKLQILNISTKALLGAIEEHRGMYQEASVINHDVLAEFESSKWLELPWARSSMRNLARVLERLGKFVEAEQLIRKVLEELYKRCGLDHAETLMVLSTLGRVLHRQGRFEEAEVLHRQALEGRTQLFAKNHLLMVISASNLALVLHDQGKHDEAYAMLTEARKMNEHIVTTEDASPENLNATSILSLVSQLCGSPDDVSVRVLYHRGRVLGNQHPSTLRSMSIHASQHYRRGRYEDSMKLYERAYLGYMNIFGREHALTTACFSSYEKACGKAGAQIRVG